MCMKRYEITKEPMYNMWVVWELYSQNLRIERFKAKTKKECKQWLEEIIK